MRRSGAVMGSHRSGRRSHPAPAFISPGVFRYAECFSNLLTGSEPPANTGSERAPTVVGLMALRPDSRRRHVR